MKLACGHGLLTSDPSVSLCFSLEGPCGVHGSRESQLGVCVTRLSVPSCPGLCFAGGLCLCGTPAASLCASLQLGAPSRCRARSAACSSIGGWFVKYGAFIFIQCGQGIGSVTQKNTLIINRCLDSKSGLGVPAWQSLLAASLSFEAVWIDSGRSFIWLQSATCHQPVF